MPGATAPASFPRIVCTRGWWTASAPTPAPAETGEPAPEETPLEYQAVNLHGDPTPTPSPTPGPTATPYFTPDPANMTFEEDD